MKSSAKKVELASVDDLFSTEESRADAGREKVVEIPLSELHSFKGHPFKVKDDDAMMETADSIRQYGVLVPAIARPDPEGGYELVAGHRRHRASELAEKETMPVIVRDLDDDAATIIMVDSNLQRESLLPSERAFAYKMKLEAMKHQGERMDLTSAQVGRKSAGKESREILAEQVGQSRNQISRYIRLTELIPELLNMVDEKKIAFNPAYELSFLKKEEQTQLLDAMDSEQATPLSFPGPAAQKIQSGGAFIHRCNAGDYGRGKEKRFRQSEFFFRHAPQVFPQKLHPCPDAGNHHQAAGTVAEKASERSGTLKGVPMRDIAARELKGHNILAVERFEDKTCWMIEFSVLRSRTAYGAPGDEMRLFLDEDGYQAVLASQKRRDIKIKRYARVIEGHILDFKPKKKRHP